MAGEEALHLFEGFGVELEYMLVGRDTLDVLPAADEVLRAASGDYESEVEQGPLRWSNELVLHVIELKTNGPVKALDGLASTFDEHVARINALLEPLEGRLMPTAMHPWMDPGKEMHLWPHEYSPVYETYHRIFDCRGHGWANLQSLHINLPFGSEEEFVRLHAAIRVLLPLMPALAASSPVVDGRRTPWLDSRMEVYRGNARRVPSVAGRVIPESVASLAAYEEMILARMYADVAPLDPEGVLQHEWLNSRGAIARFERDTIEIRVLDVQECPKADLAIAAVVVEALRDLAAERYAPLRHLLDYPLEPLAALFEETLVRGMAAAVPASLCGLLGVNAGECGTAGALWRRLWERASARVEEAALVAPVGHMLDRGSLAERICRALSDDYSRLNLRRVYEALCECLAFGELFDG